MAASGEQHGGAGEALYQGALWRAMIAYGNFLFRYRNGVFPAVMVLLFALFRPVFPGGAPTPDIWLDVLGLLIVVSGQGVRGAVIGLAYIKRGGLQKKVYAENLVTDGIFAHSRNPLYVGNLLMLAGFFVIHNNPWVYLLGGIYFLVSYRAIVAAEEQYLHANFGAAYEAYCRDVPRWWIRLRGLAATFSEMSFNWRRVVIKDYSTAMTWILTVLGLFAYQVVVARGFEAAMGLLVLFAVLALLTVGATLGIRALKKSKRLTDKAA